PGTLTLAGGWLGAGPFTLGASADGHLSQTAGTLAISGVEIIGDAAPGSLTQTGGLNSAASAVVGAQQSGSGAVTLSGGAFTIVNALTIGASGSGTLNHT